MIARHIDGKAVDYKKAAYAGVRSCSDLTVRKRVPCKSIQMARASKDSVCSIRSFEIQMARESKDSIRSNRPFEDLEDSQLACAEIATTSTVALDCTNVLGTSIQAKLNQTDSTESRSADCSLVARNMLLSGAVVR